MRHICGVNLSVLTVFLLGCLGGDWFDPSETGVADLVAKAVAFGCDPAFIGEHNPVQVLIANEGTAAAPAFSYVVKLLPGETVLASVPAPSLGKGQTHYGEIEIQLPGTLTEGTYTLLLEVDPAGTVEEIDEENNSVESLSPTYARARVADISVDAVTASEYNVAPGGPLQAQVTFGNSGTDPVPSFSYRVYLSTDAAISGGDVTVGEYAAGGVPAGSTAVENLSATVPTGASAGTDYYLIILADPADLVPETDEGNNTGYDSTVFHVVELPKRRAVAVGISDYLWIGDLAYCDADAIDFGSTLSAADEWAVSDVNVLVNQFAYKADIEAAIASAGAELSAGDTFVFFFSGHGGSDTDLAPFDELDGWDEYICTYDSDLFVWDYDIRDDELEQWLQNYIPAGVETCVIIDSCNSGGMAKGKWGGSSLAEGLADDFRRRAKGGVQAKDIDALSPLVGLFASTETEDSWEDSFLMHGVFTYFVLAALNSPSTDADTNGWYSGEEVFDVAGPATTVYEPSQHPVLVDNCPGELDFRTAE